jgi:peptide/nickel transport system substrate-binding protein
MRERHIFWDIAPLLMLGAVVILLTVVVIQNERGWGVMRAVRKEQNELANQNQKLLTLLSQGIQVSGSNPNHTPFNNNGGARPISSRPPGYEHVPPEVALPELPNVVRGDEKADDGDMLVLGEHGEPNSLNYLIDNDATASDLFMRVHEPLGAYFFDDPAYWEPRLALAWSKELVCLAQVRDGKAAELAKEIETKWDANLRKKLQIKKISADGPDVLRIEISDVNNEYGPQLKKDFGDRIQTQHWLYVNFQGQFLMDGTTRLNAEFVSRKIMDSLQNLPDFKGKFLPTWNREDSVVVKVLGDQKERDIVDAALKKMVASPDNKALLLDPGTASGKREDKMISYDLSEEYMAQEKPVFTFYLRKDVKWDDGTPFTGKDAVFTFKTVMNPQVECGPLRNYLQDCESVSLVDDNPYVLRFTWNKPYFGAFSTSIQFVPIAEHYYKFDDPKQFNQGKQNQWLVGNGRFKLSKWEREQRFVFTRNDQYYGQKPHVKGLVFRIVKDPSVELQLLEAGDLDVMGLTPSQYKTKEKSPEFQKRFGVDISVANNYRYVGWNARDTKFKDKKVRQALTMLIDRERICKDIYRGYAVPQHGPTHPENPAYWKELEKRAWPFDPARAKKQLADAGWKDTDGDGILDKSGTAFKFTLLIPSGSPEMEAMANLIKDSLGQAGIEMSINNLEWKAFLQKIERLQFEAFILGWRLDLEEDPYQLFHSSQVDEKESNHCYFVNKEADRLIEQCRRELNEEKRFEMLHKFQEMILEEQPYTFLNVPKRIVAYDKRIQNIKYRLTGSALTRWWVPAAEQKRKE